MNEAYRIEANFSFFSEAQQYLVQIINQLLSEGADQSQHGQIEELIRIEGNKVLKLLLQGYLNMKADNEVTQGNVHTEDGQRLNHVRHNTSRKITSLFGEVIVNRKSYSQRNQSSVFLMDEELNLPANQYSDGLRYRLVKEAVKGSFDNACETIKQTTGGHIAKRQSLEVVQDVAQDFEAFYVKRAFTQPEQSENLLVISTDGKGIVMRSDSLRPCTQKAAQKTKKLNSRLSQGEKKNRKRMAQVAAVYSVAPHPRSPQNIMNVDTPDDNVKQFPPRILNKRVWASVERNSETVIEEAFQEALKRDPNQTRQWIVLIDGQPQQLKLIHKVMKRLAVEATIVMDFIHVLEYLWQAAWCFFDKADPDVEQWIADRAIKVLQGKCSQVAKGIRSSATKRKLTKRKEVDKCANYLLKNKSRLCYDAALANGFPIASGVIEGACRHLINDRLDITGARWGLQGAESLLKLRSLKSSGHLDEYWRFHKEQSKCRLYKHLKCT